MKKVLKIEKLTKSYNKFQLSDISFELSEGEIMGLIGQNGAGKSTLLKCIMELSIPDRGKISIANVQDEIEMKSQVGYVGEMIGMYPDLKLHQIKKAVQRFYYNWEESLFCDLIQKFSLDLGKKYKELSKGMAVKFTLALALAHRPVLLLLDEPTSGLDPIAREGLLNLLEREAGERNCSILLSSHITDDIEKISDQIVFLHAGKIQVADSKNNLMNYYYYGDLTREFSDNYNKYFIWQNKNTVILNLSPLKDEEILCLKKRFHLKRARLDEILFFISNDPCYAFNNKSS